MNRARTAFYAILAVALLIVAGHSVLASGGSPESTTAPTAAPKIAAAKEWRVSGTIQAMNGEFWTIQGSAVRVDASTHIVGDLPVIGGYVEARGIVRPDGSWTATELQVGHDIPSASPMGTPTASLSLGATSTRTATATPSPAVPTATPTASPTATPTTTPTPPPSKPNRARGRGRGNGH